MPSPVNKPHFFCARPGGALSSMISVDDLPAEYNIVGAPRVLNPADTQGMTSVGLVPARAKPWAVETTPSQASELAVINPTSSEVSKEFQTLFNKMLQDESVNARYPLLRTLSERYQNLMSTLMAQKITVPGDTRGCIANNRQQQFFQRPPGQKEYCSYWIRHGECDYQQQGCLYKHEMPLDKETLESLGLRDIPRWFRDKHGIPSLLASNNNNASTAPRLAIANNAHMEEAKPTSNELALTTPHAQRGGGNGRQKNIRGPGFNNGNKSRGNGHGNAGHHGRGGNRGFFQAHDLSSSIISNASQSTGNSSFNPARRNGSRQFAGSRPGPASAMGTPLAMRESTMTTPAPAVAGPVTPAIPHNFPPAQSGSMVTGANTMTGPSFGGSFNDTNPFGPLGMDNMPGMHQQGNEKFFKDYGCDGDNSDKSIRSVAATEKGHTNVGRSSVPLIATLRTMGPLIRGLSTDSDPITSDDVLVDHGPIGEDVIYAESQYYKSPSLTSNEFSNILVGAEFDSAPFKMGDEL